AQYRHTVPYRDELGMPVWWYIPVRQRIDTGGISANPNVPNVDMLDIAWYNPVHTIPAAGWYTGADW
ncbi:hypothetical protein BHE74_00059727, partial [Ensete ventricosum]